MAELFIGEITPVSFGFAPRGTALCNGQILQINQNQALFSLLGTTFGGDGIRTTSRCPTCGAGRSCTVSSSGYPLGSPGGVESVTLNVGQIPAHSHAPGCNNGAGNSTEPANNVWAVTKGENLYQTGANPTGTMANGVIGLTGGGQGHSNLQPYLVINFIIVLVGRLPISKLSEWRGTGRELMRVEPRPTRTPQTREGIRQDPVDDTLSRSDHPGRVQLRAGGLGAL